MPFYGVRAGTNIGTPELQDGAVTNAKVGASAAIAHSKLAAITAGRVLLGNATNVPTATALSGDVTVGNTGVTAIGSGKVTAAMQAAITPGGILAGAVTTGAVTDIGAGTSGHYLKSNGAGTPSWAAVTGGSGWTNIKDAAFTGGATSETLASAITSGYRLIFGYVYYAGCAAAGDLLMRLNNDSTAGNYKTYSGIMTNAGLFSSSRDDGKQGAYLGGTYTSGGGFTRFVITNKAAAGTYWVDAQHFWATTGTSPCVTWGACSYAAAAEISQIDVVATGNLTAGGRILLYGQT